MSPYTDPELQKQAPVLLLDYGFHCIKRYTRAQACDLNTLTATVDELPAKERRISFFLCLLAAGLIAYNLEVSTSV